ALDLRITLQVVRTVLIAQFQSVGLIGDLAAHNDAGAGRHCANSTQRYNFFSGNGHEGTFTEGQGSAGRMGFDVVVVTTGSLPNTVEIRLSAREAFWFKAFSKCRSRHHHGAGH